LVAGCAAELLGGHFGGSGSGSQWVTSNRVDSSVSWLAHIRPPPSVDQNIPATVNLCPLCSSPKTSTSVAGSGSRSATLIHSLIPTPLLRRWRRRSWRVTCAHFACFVNRISERKMNRPVFAYRVNARARLAEKGDLHFIFSVARPARRIDLDIAKASSIRPKIIKCLGCA